jgi:ABC-type polysaccharide/polyol phosphate transport system ATPase subunit
MPRRLEFADVRKSFRMRNRSDSLRDAVPRLLRRIAGRGEHGPARFTALDGISFHVDEGEVLGLVGANGAGKSTALRLAAGVYDADSGRVDVRGRVSALIELSAGFHPDLSGRENIQLVGALHGMRRDEIAERLDEMVAFADVGEYLESPVRTYSTGMAVRLGFAVAAHVPSEVLLIDEVLAVGDVEFRAKCLRLMARRREEGVSIVFVSHNLTMMEQFCDRMVFLHHGRIAGEGAPPQIVAEYRRVLAAEEHERHGGREAARRARQGTQQLRLSDVRLNDGRDEAEYRGPLVIHAHWAASEPVDGLRVRIAFHSVFGVLVATVPLPVVDQRLEGEGELEIAIPDIGLLPGPYDVSVEIHDRSGLVVLDRHDRLYSLAVDGVRPAGADGVVVLDGGCRLSGGSG